MEEFLLDSSTRLSLVDKVGDEYVARELAAEMVNVNPKVKL